MNTDIHEIVNSIVLVILGVLYFVQNSTIKTMKTALAAIDIDNIKKSVDLIKESKDHEVKLRVSKGVRDGIAAVSQRLQESNKTFHSQLNELMGIAFENLKNENWERREELLKHVPLNAEHLRVILIAFDEGMFPPKADAGID